MQVIYYTVVWFVRAMAYSACMGDPHRWHPSAYGALVQCDRALGDL